MPVSTGAPSSELMKSPWLWGGVALIVIALFFLNSGGSGSTAANASTATAADANATNIALAGYTTQTNIAALQAQTTMGQVAATSAAVNTTANLDAFLGALSFVNNAHSVDAQTQIAMGETLAGVVNNTASLDAAVTIDAQNNANRLALAPFAVQTSTNLANIGASEAESVANIEAANEQSLASIAASTANNRTIASALTAPAGSDSNGNQTSILGQVANGIGSIFGL
jgi:hypothetical protein